MSWAADEFATVALGDKRHNNRVIKLAGPLAGCQAYVEHSWRLRYLG